MGSAICWTIVVSVVRIHGQERIGPAGACLSDCDPGPARGPVHWGFRPASRGDPHNRRLRGTRRRWGPAPRTSRRYAGEPSTAFARCGPPRTASGPRPLSRLGPRSGARPLGSRGVSWRVTPRYGGQTRASSASVPTWRNPARGVRLLQCCSGCRCRPCRGGVSWRPGPLRRAAEAVADRRPPLVVAARSRPLSSARPSGRRATVSRETASAPGCARRERLPCLGQRQWRSPPRARGGRLASTGRRGAAVRVRAARAPECAGRAKRLRQPQPPTPALWSHLGWR